jgi:hypothetical protein
MFISEGIELPQSNVEASFMKAADAVPTGPPRVEIAHLATDGDVYEHNCKSGSTSLNASTETHQEDGGLARSAVQCLSPPVDAAVRSTGTNWYECGVELDDDEILDDDERKMFEADWSNPIFVQQPGSESYMEDLLRALSEYTAKRLR